MLYQNRIWRKDGKANFCLWPQYIHRGYLLNTLPVFVSINSYWYPSRLGMPKHTEETKTSISKDFNLLRPIRKTDSVLFGNMSKI